MAKDSLLGSAAQQLQKRIEIQKELDHPHALRLLEAYEDTQHIYLINEYFASSTLSDLLVQSGTMKEHEVASIVKDLLSLVAYLHNN